MTKRKEKEVCFVVAILLCLILCCGIFSACEEKDYGRFYLLRDAYRQGLISKEDLQEIADNHNAVNPESALGVSDLPKETAYKIRCAICQKYDRRISRNKEVKINGYYGTYNGYVAVSVWVDISFIDEDAECGYPLYWETYEIDGVVFYGYSGINIWVE